MYRTIDDVKRANRLSGNHWFEPATMRFFGTRHGWKLYGGRYFITSERYSMCADRRYTIREALPDGSIETVGTFLGYRTRASAIRGVRHLLNGVDVA